uniref:Uncharacterized protein n=1 Tax=Rhodnius prolixus TaxID=13249 RepID=T1HIE8_RHOPR
MRFISAIELTFLYNWVKKSLNSNEYKEIYGGLKFGGKGNIQNVTFYISISILFKTMRFISAIELIFLYNWVKKSLNSNEYKEIYGGLKFGGKGNFQNVTFYISITILFKTMRFISAIELTFLYNWVKKSLNSNEYKEIYGGLKFGGKGNFQNVTFYISITILFKTMRFISAIELIFLYNWVKKSLNSNEYKEIYGGLKFGGKGNFQNETFYISITIMIKTMRFISAIELTFLYNWVKKSLNSDEKKERYGGLKFGGK